MESGTNCGCHSTLILPSHQESPWPKLMLDDNNFQAARMKVGVDHFTSYSETPGRSFHGPVGPRWFWSFGFSFQPTGDS